VEFEAGAARFLALEVRERDADDVGYRRVRADRHDRSLQQVAAVADGLGRRVDVEGSLCCADVEDLDRVVTPSRSSQ
jgi:hypothetical protein